MKRAKVIAVCDEPRLLRAVARQACQWVDVVQTLSRQRALLCLKQNPGASLLVTDRLLQQEGGTDFLTSVSRQFPEVCRCLLTSYSDLAAVVRAIHDGLVDAMVHVPLSQRQFLAAVTQKPLRTAMRHVIPTPDAAPQPHPVVVTA